MGCIRHSWMWLQGQPVIFKNIAADDSVSLSINLYDEAGQLLIEIDEFVLRRVSQAAADSLGGEALSSSREEDESDSGLLAILPKEGSQVINRILNSPKQSHIVVSTSSLDYLLDQLQRGDTEESLIEDTEGNGISATHERPELSTEYVEPIAGVEASLATIWKNVLGMDRVGRRYFFNAESVV